MNEKERKSFLLMQSKILELEENVAALEIKVSMLEIEAAKQGRIYHEQI